MAKTKSNRGGKNFIDLTGRRFGRLAVIERAPNRGSSTMWMCQCDCGTKKAIAATSIVHGLTSSCGCKHVDAGRRRTIDLSGQTFNRLTVLAQVGSNAEGKALWQCRCDCGAITVVMGKALRRGTTNSCGCWRRDVTGNCSRTHGMSGTAEHKAWKHAKERCFNPSDKAYTDYGGRGITMCQEWADSFAAFYEHIGPRPKGHSIDRIDNDKGYEPGNVRWTTRKQQNNNRRKRRWKRKPNT